MVRQDTRDKFAKTILNAFEIDELTWSFGKLPVAMMGIRIEG